MAAAPTATAETSPRLPHTLPEPELRPHPGPAPAFALAKAEAGEGGGATRHLSGAKACHRIVARLAAPLPDFIGLKAVVCYA